MLWKKSYKTAINNNKKNIIFWLKWKKSFFSCPVSSINLHSEGSRSRLLQTSKGKVWDSEAEGLLISDVLSHRTSAGAEAAAASDMLNGMMEQGEAAAAAAAAAYVRRIWALISSRLYSGSPAACWWLHAHLLLMFISRPDLLPSLSAASSPRWPPSCQSLCPFWGVWTNLTSVSIHFLWSFLISICCWYCFIYICSLLIFTFFPFF